MAAADRHGWSETQYNMLCFTPRTPSSGTTTAGLSTRPDSDFPVHFGADSLMTCACDPCNPADACPQHENIKINRAHDPGVECVHKNPQILSHILSHLTPQKNARPFDRA